MKSIKKIADEIGVSKQAVRNQIANLGLQSSLQKNGNQFAIDENQERQIKQAFKGATQSKSQSGNANQAQSEPQTINAVIDTLTKQLEVKDNQIAALQSALQAEQMLHADTKKILSLPAPTDSVDEENKNSSRGLWSRIFGKGSK